MVSGTVIQSRALLKQVLPVGLRRRARGVEVCVMIFRRGHRSFSSSPVLVIPVIVLFSCHFETFIGGEGITRATTVNVTGENPKADSRQDDFIVRAKST